MFECLFHLSYKLGIKDWQARTQEDKQIISERKELIKQELKTKLSLPVDSPKQGYGNNNDGNTARRFFENSQVSSEITGTDVEIS